MVFWTERWHGRPSFTTHSPCNLTHVVWYGIRQQSEGQLIVSSKVKAGTPVGSSTFMIMATRPSTRPIAVVAPGRSFTHP